jgi:hypothetical protein
MASAVEQSITVKIRALVDGLKSVNELQSAIRAIQSSGNKKFNIGTGDSQPAVSKLVMVVRQLSPAFDNAAARGENLAGVLGTGTGLSGVLGPLGILFGVLAGAGIGVAGVFYAASARAAEFANRIGELQDKTGLQAETLSAVAVAAENTDSNIEQFADGVTKLNRTVAEANDKSKEAREKLIRLGIDPQQAMRDLDAAVGQAFKKIADAPNAAEAARLATDAFGKSGANLIPTIKSFDGDLEKAKKTAAEFGRLLNDEGVRAARQFDDNLDSLTNTAKGLEAQLGNRLIPELNKLFNLINAESRNSASVFGVAFGLIVGQIRQANDGLLVFLAGLKTMGQAGPTGFLDGTFQKNLGQLIKEAYTPAPGANKPGGPGSPGGGGKGGGGKTLAQRLAELAAQQQKAEGELSAAESTARADSIKDSLEREKALITKGLEARLISYRDYYAALTRIETEAIDQEILRQLAALDKIQSELNAKRKELDADKKLKPAEREAKKSIAVTEAEAKAVPILEKINELERDRAGVVSRVTADAIKTTEDYQRQLTSLKDELAQFKVDLDGDGKADKGAEAPSVTAARHAIDERFRVLREQAVANADEAAVAVIDALKKRLVKSAQFEAVEQKIREVFQRIRDAEDFHQAEADTGQISQEEADRRKLQAARLQREALERLHGELKGIAKATKDPELLAAVDRLGIEIAQVGVEVNRLAQDINRDLKQALDDTLFAIIRRQQTLKEAISSLVNHILDELARLASSAIIEQVFGENGILGGIFGGKSGGQGGIGGILSGIFRPRTSGQNPQAPQGNTSIFDTLPGVIKNFQANAVAGLGNVNQSTKGVEGGVFAGFQSVNSKVQEIVTFLPNLLTPQPAWWQIALQAAIGAVGVWASGKVGGGGGGKNSKGIPRADGGLVTGTGTSTSDSIHAMLSNGEFVIRAEAVRKLGLGILDHINRIGRLPALDLPAFAMGGAVNIDVPDISNAPLFTSLREGLNFQQVNHFNVKSEGGKVSQANQAQIERDIARATEKGARRSIASRK